MGNINFRLYKRISEVQLKHCLVFLFILLFILLISEVLFFDTKQIDKAYGSIYDLTGKDYDVFYTLYNNNLIGLQGYVFGLAFSLLLALIYFIFSSQLIHDSLKMDMAVLTIRKGNIKSSHIYLRLIYLNILIASLISLLILPLINLIINSILDTKLKLMIPNYVTFIFWLIVTALYIMVVYFVNLTYFKKHKLINLLREIF